MSGVPRRAISLALTGASGAPYGLRLLQCLVESGVQVHLMLSKPAQVVLALETELEVPGRPPEVARYSPSVMGQCRGRSVVTDPNSGLPP